MRKITTLLAAILLTGLSTFVLASPGGLDKFGGHVDHATGKYHYHRDKNGNKLVPPVEAPNPNVAGNSQGAPVTAAKAEKAVEPVKAEKAAAVTTAPAATAPTSAPAEKQSKQSKKAEKKAEKKAAKKAAKAEKATKATEKKETTPEATKKSY